MPSETDFLFHVPFTCGEVDDDNKIIRGVSLMTNNPRKVDGLENAGIHVARRIPLQIAASPHTARYLATKRDRLGHLLDLISPVTDD